MSDAALSRGYEVVDFGSLPGTACPCGTARRAFVDTEDFPGTIHVTEISETAREHYHKRLTETYFFLDGSLSSGNPYTIFPDSSILSIGSGSDLNIQHDGNNSYLDNNTGDLIIQNYANDKDIIFKSDDGEGGTATYFKLDGSYTAGIDGETYTPSTVFPDHALLALGTHRDLKLWYNNVRGRIAYTGGNEFVITALNNLNIGFNDSDGVHTETAITCYKDDRVQIRHDNSPKFETQSDGVKVYGATALTETTTPTATADVGKIYTKTDNKLYFQDGAGTEHEIAFA